MQRAEHNASLTITFKRRVRKAHTEYIAVGGGCLAIVTYRDAEENDTWHLPNVEITSFSTTPGGRDDSFADLCEREPPSSMFSVAIAGRVLMAGCDAEPRFNL